MSSAQRRATIKSNEAKRRGAPHGWAAPYLFVTALVVPLVYSKSTIDPVLLPRFLLLALLGIVLVTGFGLRVLRSRATLSLLGDETLVLGILVASILVAAISALVTRPTPDGMFELLKLTTFLWLVYASSRAIGGERSTLALVAMFVVVASILVGGFAILQYYRIAIFEWMKQDTTVDSTMASRNLLASFLMLAFPFSAYAFLDFKGPWQIVSAVAVLISVFLMVALQTRAVWVAFPLGLAFGLFLLTVVTKRTGSPAAHSGGYRLRSIQGVVLMALAASMALLLYSPGARAPMREHAGSLVQFQDASIRERLQLWSRTLQMIREHPLKGVGPGNWRTVIPAYGTEGLRSDTGTLHFQRPHNDFLWVASETGVVGGLLYVTLFASVLWVAVSAMAHSPSARHRLVLTLMSVGVSCYVLDSFFSFPKERMAHTVYLSLLVGTIFSFRRDAPERPVTRSLSRRWSLAIVTLVWILALMAGGVAWSRYRAEVHLRRALEARAVRNWPLMVAELDRIDRHEYVMDPTATPVDWYRGVAQFEMGNRDTALSDFLRALAVHPNHVHVLNNIATCYALKGEQESAIRTYERAIEIAPRFEEARVNLGFLLHNSGKDQEAYAVLAPAAAYAVSPRFQECFRLVKAALGRED